MSDILGYFAYNVQYYDIVDIYENWLIYDFYEIDCSNIGKFLSEF